MRRDFSQCGIDKIYFPELREPAMKPDTTLVSLSMRELDRLKVIEAVAEARLMTWRAAGLRCK
jgi:hypothetical protein